MDIRRYRNGSHQVRGNARRPFRHARRIQNLANSTTTHSSLLPDHYFIWDPSEPVATRPLAWKRGTSVAYYTHDGNKNVSEVIASGGTLAAHYEYAPFGALTVSRGASAGANPWRFSSEYAEDDTATVYYNYRHYEPVTGRWMQRDPILDLSRYVPYRIKRRNFKSVSEYTFCGNYQSQLDELGLLECCCDGKRIDCDEKYKWKGSITVASVSYYIGIGYVLINIESNVVCDKCAKYKISISKLLTGVSLGFWFSLTGSEIEFGNFAPEDFVGSITIVAGGIAAMGGVEASYVSIGNAFSYGISPVGGGELGVSASIGLGDVNPDIEKIPCGELK